METRTPHILAIDGMNFLHRARAGFNAGDYYVVFNAFRNLRALVEMHSPTRVYFVTEGHPKWRYDLMSEYKANRVIEQAPDGSAVDPKQVEKLQRERDFYRQAGLVVQLLSQHFPVSIIRHPDHECDDTIYNLIRRATTAVPWTVCSNDSDFTQLLGQFPHVRLYNPMTKEFVDDPVDFQYVTWKALRGDGSDNIPGIPGIGNKRADEIASDPDLLREFLSDQEHARIFQRNYRLIEFKTWSDDEAAQMTSSSPERNWSAVEKAFTQWEFKSLLKDKTWDKFRNTFDPLWGDTGDVS